MFKTYVAQATGFVKTGTVERAGRTVDQREYFQLGWHVCAYVGGDMDTPIETIGHCAVFQRKEDAERLAARIQTAQNIDSALWILAAHDDYVSGFRREPGEEQPALYSPLVKPPCESPYERAYARGGL
jgi:hypothetical protein